MSRNQAMKTDPRIKWIPYYDMMRDLMIWTPAEWDKCSKNTRFTVERIVKDEPIDVPGKTKIEWDRYDKLRASLAPDPRRDWIIV